MAQQVPPLAFNGARVPVSMPKPVALSG